MALKKNQIDKLFGSVKAGNISDLTQESLKKSLTKDAENESKAAVNETSNDSQTVVNKTSNGSQTVVNKTSNGSQTVVNETSNGSQTVVNETSNGSQTVVNETSNGSQTVVNETSNGSQTVVNETSNDNKNLEINQFSGLQKNILNYLFENIENLQSRVTKELTIEHIVSGVNATRNMAKQAIYRCKQKNVISVKDRKDGRGGWCKYQLSKSIFVSIQNNQNGNKKPIYNSNTTNTINKYSNDTKEQKTTTPQNDQLIELIKQQNDKIAELQKQFLQQAPQVQPETKTVTVTELTENNTLESDNEDWADLDFSSLAEFGFTKRHVTQIKNFNKSLDADNQLTIDSVQESIEHYAWALQNRLDEMVSYAPANNRLRGLIGVLKKGGNWTEANYKSPEDLAFEASLIAKKERLEKIKAQKEEVLNLEFELWRESLTATEIMDIEENGELQGKMPPSAFKNKGDNKHYVAALRTYFKQNIYKG
ncbi:hypothetical protein [Cysteiniphilum marinum]|uniref:hypothetical protein n=1 Tax=Cysteiniphilum marinum TaxID=2774191 RepID=UPI00193BD6A7|nr:hypothetical protein [Cysteiniphilum marinum]